MALSFCHKLPTPTSVGRSLFSVLRLTDSNFVALSPRGTRCFGVAVPSRQADADFKKAQDNLGSLTEDPGNRIKLQLYALFKQATIGTCNSKKPGMTDFVGRAKWTAWNDLGNLSQDDAKKKYVEVVASLINDNTIVVDAVSEGNYKELVVKKEKGILKITKNRPAKKNAINYGMYEELQRALTEGAADNSVVLATMTGAGDFYSSGNDLGNFMNVAPDDMPEMAKKGGDILENYVNAYINFPKPLIGMINGPAVGVAVTVLGLFDAVYAAESATFHTPFSSLGQTPEGCSSDTFPKILGPQKAGEVLLFNKKLTASEASALGLVTEVFPDGEFQEKAWSLVHSYAELPKGSLLHSKALMRPEEERERLRKVNRSECDRLIERWQSAECVNAIMKFFSK